MKKIRIYLNLIWSLFIILMMVAVQSESGLKTNDYLFGVFLWMFGILTINFVLWIISAFAQKIKIIKTDQDKSIPLIHLSANDVEVLASKNKEMPLKNPDSTYNQISSKALLEKEHISIKTEKDSILSNEINCVHTIEEKEVRLSSCNTDAQVKSNCSKQEASENPTSISLEETEGLRDKIKNEKEYDFLLFDAAKFIIEKNKASVGMLQRTFKIGFNRASRIMNQLADIGIVGPEEGTMPRKILISMEAFESLKENVEDKLLYSSEERDIDNSVYEDPIADRIQMYNNKFDYMEGHDFEYFCADLLKKAGFISVEVTQGSNDNGIDILASRGGVKYGIQCKCYSSDIGVKAVQEAFSGAKYYDCHVPVVMTNRHFTRQAKEMAQKTNVLLWDRTYLEAFVNNSIK